jgi:hypothetical protein
MKIVLDTNIYRENTRMDKLLFERLIRYGERTRADFVVPKIVAQELPTVHRSHLQEEITRLRSAVRKVNSALASSAPISMPEIDVDAEVDGYVEFILAKLGVEESAIIPYKPEFLEEVVRRAVNRIRPCSDSGEEFRDALLWLTCIEIAKEKPTEPTVFISRNTKQFAAGGSLHPDLVADVADAGVNLLYYQTIDTFLADHAERIEFITAEWVESNIFVDGLWDSVTEWLEYSLEEMRDYFSAHGMRYRGRPVATMVSSLSLENFFVEPHDRENDFLVDVIYKARVEVELEHQEAFQNYSGDDYFMAPVTATFELPVEVVVELFVSDGEVQDTHDYFRFAPDGD